MKLKVGLLILVLTVFVSPDFAFSADNFESKALTIVKKAVYGIIKTAGDLGATKACEMVMSEVFCQVVVAPTMEAIYEEIPSLKPAKGDSAVQLEAKADRTIRYLKRSEALQQLMVEKFAKLGQQQEMILSELNEFGATQEQIQRTLTVVLKILQRQGKEIREKHKSEKRIKLRTQAAELELLNEQYKQYSTTVHKLMGFSGNYSEEQLSKMLQDDSEYIGGIKKIRETTLRYAEKLKNENVPLETLENQIIQNDEALTNLRVMVENLKTAVGAFRQSNH